MEILFGGRYSLQSLSIVAALKDARDKHCYRNLCIFLRLTVYEIHTEQEKSLFGVVTKLSTDDPSPLITSSSNFVWV